MPVCFWALLRRRLWVQISYLLDVSNIGRNALALPLPGDPPYRAPAPDPAVKAGASGVAALSRAADQPAGS